MQCEIPGLCVVAQSRERGSSTAEALSLALDSYRGQGWSFFWVWHKSASAVKRWLAAVYLAVQSMGHACILHWAASTVKIRGILQSVCAEAEGEGRERERARDASGMYILALVVFELS
jgi:hypothetical protein